MNKETMTTLWKNANIATMNSDIDGGYGLLKNHDILVEGKKIIAIQPTGTLSADTVIALDNALITPSLIDCHTHLVFAGNRANEWEQRQNGVSYQQISAEGGGINSTVRATREISEDDLFNISQQRLNTVMREGVGLLEIKSGYGLDLDNEAKVLRVAKKLAKDNAIEISRTLLAAHTTPPEFKGNSDAYIDTIIDTIMPTLWAEGLFDCVDVFCEKVGFSYAQTERLFAAAKSLGIPVKGHTEQLSLLGGSELVAEYDGWSADHIEYLNESGVDALAQHDTVAVLLPGAFYFLAETQKPPVQLLRDKGVSMAVATDFNPGTSPFSSLRLAMNMACVQFGLTPLEAWQGVTVNAAKALRRQADFGILSEGKPAHFNIWQTEHPVDIIYELNRPFLRGRVFHGNPVLI